MRSMGAVTTSLFLSILNRRADRTWWFGDVWQEPCSHLSSRLHEFKRGGEAGSSDKGRNTATVTLAVHRLSCTPGSGTFPICCWALDPLRNR